MESKEDGEGKEDKFGVPEVDDALDGLVETVRELEISDEESRKIFPTIEDFANAPIRTIRRAEIIEVKEGEDIVDACVNGLKNMIKKNHEKPIQ